MLPDNNRRKAGTDVLTQDKSRIPGKEGHFFLRFYLLERQRESKRERAHTQAGGEAEAEGEADTPLCRKPNAGLDPRTPRS